MKRRTSSRLQPSCTANSSVLPTAGRAMPLRLCTSRVLRRASLCALLRRAADTSPQLPTADSLNLGHTGRLDLCRALSTAVLRPGGVADLSLVLARRLLRRTAPERALWSASFLALCLMVITAWSRSRLLLAGFLLALTPMTMFLASTVNPNGLEITVAACLWVAGLVLVLERAEDPPGGLIAVITVAACALPLVRVVSPLWVGLIGLALVGLGDPRQLGRLVRRHRGTQICLGLVVLFTLAGALWLLVVHADQTLPGYVVPKGITTAHKAALAAGLTGPYFAQLVGYFGWTDTGSPLLTMWVWFCGVGFAAVAAVIVARLRQVMVLVSMVVLVVAIPVVFNVATAQSRGFVWQGRYGLPLAVGIPLAGMALVDRSGAFSRRTNRLLAFVGIGVFLADVAAFAAALRRNTVGIGGPTDPFKGGWQPPLGAVSVTVWFRAGRGPARWLDLPPWRRSPGVGPTSCRRTSRSTTSLQPTRSSICKRRKSRCQPSRAMEEARCRDAPRAAGGTCGDDRCRSEPRSPTDDCAGTGRAVPSAPSWGE